MLWLCYDIVQLAHKKNCNNKLSYQHLAVYTWVVEQLSQKTGILELNFNMHQIN